MPSALLGTVLHQARRLAAARGDEGRADADLLQAFAQRHDQEAFGTLVRRHGPMVLNVCRRLLHQRQDAEDAFQATFLILARKAASVQKPQALVSWLYGVAYRMALSVRRAAVRSRTQERRARAMTTRDPGTDLAWREVQAVLEEEIQRLPEAHRAVFVLCCLENKSRDEVAQLLGLKSGTVSSRLARARKQLQQRLARRGVALSSSLGATALARPADASALPAALFAATTRAAAWLTAGEGIGPGPISPRLAALVDGGFTTVCASKKVLVAALALTLGVITGGTGLVLALQSPSAKPPVEKAAQSPESFTQRAKEKSSRTDRQGDRLPPGALARLGTLRFRHDDNVQQVVFLPGGRLVATVAGTTVHVWDASTGKERARLPQGRSDPDEKAVRRPNWIRALASSPDGALLAAGDNEGTVRLWEVAVEKPLRSWQAHAAAPENSVGSGGVLEVAFGRDGKTLITAGLDKTLRVWNPASGTEMRRLRGHEGTPVALTVSPDGRLLACSDFTGFDRPGCVRLWDLGRGKEVRALAGPDKKPATCLTFAPDGRTLAAAFGMWPNTTAEIKVWDLTRGKETVTLAGHSTKVTGLRFSADGATLRSVSLDGSVRDSDPTTGREVHRTQIPWGGIARATLTPDGKRVVSYGFGALHFWDAETGQEWPLTAGSDWPVTLAFSPNGRLVATADGIGPARLWDTATGREVRPIGKMLQVSPYFSADGKTLVTIDRDADGVTGVVCLWETVTGKELRRMKVGPYLHHVAASDDGRFLVAGGSTLDPTARIWDLVAGKEVRAIPLPALCNSLAVSPDGRTLAAAAHTGAGKPGDRYVHLWDIATGKVLHQLEPADQRQVLAVAFSPDGKMLASAGLDLVEDAESGKRIWRPAVKLWDVTSGRLRLRTEPGNKVTGLTFSPNGLLLAVVNNGSYVLPNERPKDHTVVRLLDVYTGKELHRFAGHRAAVTAAAFSSDGSRLATGSKDTTALLWDIPGAVRRGNPGVDRPEPEELQTLWKQLAGFDEVAPYQAMGRLRSSGADLVAQRLLTSLRPDARADAWIVDLDSSRFAIRDKAEKELARLGDAAEGSLRKALAAKPSPEARRRIENLLKNRGGAGGIRSLRAVELLEHMDTPLARKALETIAQAAADARLASEAKAAGTRMARRAAARP